MFRLSSIGRFFIIGGVAAMVVTACGGTNNAATSPTPVDVGSGSLTCLSYFQVSRSTAFSATRGAVARPSLAASRPSALRLSGLRPEP